MFTYLPQRGREPPSPLFSFGKSGEVGRDPATGADTGPGLFEK